MAQKTIEAEEKQKECQIQKEHWETIRVKNEVAKQQISTMKQDELNFLKEIMDKEKEKLELENKKQGIQKKITEIEDNKEKSQADLNAKKAQLSVINKEIEEKKVSHKKKEDDWRNATKAKEDLKHKIQKEEKKAKGYELEMEKMTPIIKALEEQIKDVMKETQYKNRTYIEFTKDSDIAIRELNALKNINHNLECEIDDLREDKEKKETFKHHEEGALDELKKLLNNDQGQVDEAQRDKGKMEGQLKDHKNDIYKTDSECHQLESRAKKLENQNKGYEIESIKLKNIIRDLQNQQAKYGAEASTAHARFYQTVEELKIKNTVIDEMQKKNVDLENKLKHQQNLYEAVRSDKNLYSKSLLEHKHETTSLIQKFTMMSHSINQLKEENRRKDEQFMKESLNFHNADKQKKAIMTKELNIRKKIDSTIEFIKHHETQIAKLKYIIGEAQSEKQKQVKDKEMVLNERDILGAQLIKRKQELEVLDEKVKISQSNLSKGEKHFRDEIGRAHV